MVRVMVVGAWGSWLAVPTVALAGPAAAEESPEVAEVRRLYEEGKARYETLDYEGAIDLWTQAYALVPADDANRQIKNNLAYNIASAQEKAFELDADVTHLRRARGLLEKYVEEYKRMYEPTPETRAEVKKVNERIAELDQRIREHEQAVAPAAAQAQPTAPAPVANPAKERQAAVRDLLRSDPEISPKYRSGRGMIIGGSVLLSAGAVVVLVGTAIIGASDPDSSNRRQDLIGGGLTIGLGGGMIAGGAVMLAMGVKKRKAAVLEAEQRVKVAWAPWVGRYGAGTSFALRF